MTAGGDLPDRVLVVWCPGWPEAGQETGTAGDDAGPGDDTGLDGGAAPGAGQRAPEFGPVRACRHPVSRMSAAGVVS